MLFRIQSARRHEVPGCPGSDKGFGIIVHVVGVIASESACQSGALHSQDRVSAVYESSTFGRWALDQRHRYEYAIDVLGLRIASERAKVIRIS